MCYLTLKFRNQNKKSCHAASHRQQVTRNLFPSLFSSSCPRIVSSTQIPTPLSFFVFVIVFVRHLAIETSSENLNSNLSSLYVPYCAVPSQDYSLSRSLFLSLSLFHFSSICLFHSVEFCSHLSNKTKKCYF
uniref:(northern house mosquito) hypothetical protein n=1 Tax=Culex pipiens TaxID=7175 RepID=A0A8D8CKW3_CULPI